MKFGLRTTDITILKGIFKEFSQIHEVLIFGSRAMGNNKMGSDIDIALKGEITDKVMRGVRMELEDSPLPYFFDVVNYGDITHQKLKDHIDEFGKVL